MPAIYYDKVRLESLAGILERDHQASNRLTTVATVMGPRLSHVKRSRELDTKLKSIRVHELNPLRERAHTMRPELDTRSKRVARLE